MANQKLTDKTQKAVLPNDALVHVVFPSDTSQSPDGSSYKVLVNDLAIQAGQDNIDIRKNVLMSVDDTKKTILSKINALPPYTINEKQSVWFICMNEAERYNNVRALKFKMLNKGKGTYGLGNTQLALVDIELVYDNIATITDVENDPTTDIVDYGDIAGQDISEWLNAQSPAIVIQPQDEGYTLFKGSVDGTDISYLWVGEPGVYGVGESSSTMEDFQTISDEIPDNSSLYLPVENIVNYDLANNTSVIVDDAVYNNCPLMIDSLKNNIFVFWGQAADHVGTGGGVVKWKKSIDGGKTFTPDATLISEPGIDVRGIGGGKTATGRIILFYNRGGSGATLNQGFIYTDDEGENWSDYQTITGIGDIFVPYGKMITLAGGRLMKDFYVFDGLKREVYVVFSNDNGNSWGTPVLVVTSTSPSVEYTESAFEYLPGGIVIGLIRNDVCSSLTQVVSLDNGATWTNQGIVNFGDGCHVSPWLNKYEEIDGELYLSCFYGDRLVGNNVRAIVGKALDVAADPNAWDLSSLTNLDNNGANADFGYPSAVNTKQGKKHILVYYKGITSSDSNIYITNFTPNTILNNIPDDSNLLHTTGNESKTGNFTLNGYPAFKNDGAIIDMFSPSSVLKAELGMSNYVLSGGSATAYALVSVNDLEFGVYGVKKAILNSAGLSILGSGSFTGEVTVPTAVAGTSAAQLQQVDAKVAQTITNGVTTSAPSQDAVFDALALKANSASPALTGTPTTPTATAGTSTTQIASTAFVGAALAANFINALDATLTVTTASSTLTVPGTWGSGAHNNGNLNIYANASSNAITINLPTAVSMSGRTVNIIKTDASANAVTINGGGTNINAATTYVLSNQYERAIVKSNSTQFYIF